MAVDTSAGDATPKLSQASIIKAVTAVNLLYANLEVPLAGVPGPIRINRDVNISTTDGTRAVYGTQLNVSQGSLRTTILQQSVNTNDERTYLLNNASASAGTTYSGTFVYDKTGAAASHYLQTGGAHYFATAPNGAADAGVTFTTRVKIDSTGAAVTGVLVVTNNVAGNASIANFLNTINGTNLNLASVNSTDAFVQGSFLGDSAVRAETGNLMLGSLAGNTTIGTSTKMLARWNSSGTVVMPGPNSAAGSYGGFAFGGGITAVVGAGSNGASDGKSFWLYNNPVTLSYIGGGMQLNAQNGLDFWTGNSAPNAWIRSFQLQTSGKALFGGVQGATAIGDVHINNIGADTSGSLSLTGLGGASYLVMGNRDSLGTAGPAVIAASNRRIQFGVGDSFVSRSGGSFTEYACVEGGSFGVGVTNPSTYGPMAVVVTNGSAIAQVVMALKSPSTLGATGTLAGGVGMYWGNNVFVGERVVNGGDANNAGLAFMVGYGGVSNEAGRFNTTGDLTVRGSTINLGTNSVSVLGVNATKDTYLRGDTISFQNSAANVTWTNYTSSLITHQIDTQFNGNLVVNGTIVSSRQIEKTSDKVVGNGVVVFDYNTTSLWMTSGATANWTANFTNVGTAPGQSITVTIIHQQGSTGYWPTAVQINGSAATIRWAGGMAPVPTPNNVDVFQFSLIRTTSNTWMVLGSATPFV